MNFERGLVQGAKPFALISNQKKYDERQIIDLIELDRHGRLPQFHL